MKDGYTKAKPFKENIIKLLCKMESGLVFQENIISPLKTSKKFMNMGSLVIQKTINYYTHALKR